MKKVLFVVLCIILLFQSFPAAFAEAEEGEELSAEDMKLENIDLSAAESLPKDKNIMNILLLGTDEKLAYTHDIGRSDCVMLVSLNHRTGDMKLISFERGIMVDVPPELAEGRTQDLLTHAYHWCGVDFMVETIEKLFDVPIDGYAQVDFYEFIDVIDAIGGIDMDIEYMEAIMMNHGEPVTTNAHMLLGRNHLDGHDAMVYCRLRSPDDDWGRQERQRKTILAVMEKLKTLNLKEAVSLMDQIVPLVHTNLSASSCASIVLHAKRFLNGTIEQLQVPEKNQNPDGSISCNFPEQAERIRNFIND